MKPGGAFKGIKVSKAKSEEYQSVEAKPVTSIEPLKAKKEEVNPYVKRVRTEEDNSEQLKKLCDKAIKAFMQFDKEKFVEHKKELIYLRSKQAIIRMADESQGRDIKRVGEKFS